MKDLPGDICETAAHIVMGCKANVQFGSPDDVDALVDDVANALASERKRWRDAAHEVCFQTRHVKMFDSIVEKARNAA